MLAKQLKATKLENRCGSVALWLVASFWVCAGASSLAKAQTNPASSSATLPSQGSTVPAANAANRPGGTWKSIASLPAFVGGLWSPTDKTLAETIALENLAFPPLNSTQMAISRRKVRAIMAGTTDLPNAACKPLGLPWILWGPYWQTFLYTPGAVVMITVGGGTDIRTIVTDGSSLPAGVADPNSLETPPTDLGYSVGRWDGDTLVVETRGLSADNLVAHGVPNGGGMTITERYRLVEPDRLELRMTVDAPRVFTKPWDVIREFTRTPMSRIDSGHCDPEVSREKLDANGNLSIDLTPPSEQKKPH